MAKNYDLNTFVQEYLVTGKPNLEDLTERLENVPVSLHKLEAMLRRKYDYDLSDLWVRAELISPEMRMLLLDELTDTIEQADSITERIAMPYTSILINGEYMSRGFYRKNKNDFGSLILPNPSDPSAKVLSRKGVPGVAVMFDNKEKRHGRLDYIEMILVTNFV